MPPEKRRARRGRGEGSVRYLPAKKMWEAAASLGRRPDGSRHRATVYGKTKKEALDKLRKLQESPRVASGDRISLHGFVELFLASKRRSVARSTHERYVYAASYVTKYLGHLRMKDVGVPHIAQWYVDMDKDQVSASNQAKSAQLLGMVFRAAMKQGVCIANPVDVVDKPKPPTKELEFLTPDQIKLFLEATDRCRMFGLFATALGTGARLGELLALEWDDVNFEAETITFRRSLSEVRGEKFTKNPKTAAGKRTVAAPKFVIEALHQQLKNNVTEGLAGCPICFPTRTGNHQSRSNIHKYYLKPILESAGLPPVSFHALRHSCATWLLSCGATAKDVASILGHTNARFTIDRYTHTLPASRTAAIARMDEALG